jgi:F-type H+-transporting ATPase subunit b
MLKKSLLLLALMTGVAYAQHGDVPATAETPTANPTVDPGTATQNPPNIEDDTETGGVHHGGEGHGDGTGGGHGGGHGKGADHGAHDPSKHFRFFGGPFSGNGKDIYGGKLGDDKMVDEHGNVVLDNHGKPYEEPMSAPFIFMLLNFAVLLAILAWKGAPVFSGIAKDRHDQIKTALDEAAKLRKAAADKLAEYETRLKDADSDIKKIVDGLKADAESDKKRILENAERQAAQMKKDAETRIAAEIELARATLTKEVTAAAAAATETILRAQVDHSDQAKLVNAFITDLQSSAPRKEAR